MAKRARSAMSWILLVALVVVGGLTVFQIVRSVNAFVYWRIHADEPIQDWMTIGFVAHSYHVPPHVLHQAMGLPIWPRDHRALKRIAAQQGLSFETLRARLLYGIVHARPPYPPPKPPPPPPAGLDG